MVSKVPYHKVKAGDRLVTLGPSGGGKGNPLRREPQAVLADVLEGFISADAAAADYGVVLNGCSVDAAATAARRAAPA